MKQLFGLETEYGLAAQGKQENRSANAEYAIGGSHAHTSWDLVNAVRAMLPGLPDVGAGGVFLANGSRVYVDSSHPESATPEVSTPWDLVRYTLAGQRVLEKALARSCRASRRSRPLLHKSNVDYLTRRSWGCHESIQYRAGTRGLSDRLIPHLVSRVVFTGAGGFDPHCPGISFVLSPRALFLQAPVSRSSTDDRGIFHIKDEPLSLGPHKRLHLICGESLCSERAMWLKTATTVLVVAMIDAGLATGASVALADPVAAFHTIVRDPSCRVEVPLAAGRTTTALALQRHYLRAAEARIGAEYMPEWTRTACEYWRAMLDQLERAPDSVATTLDWGIKRALFERVLARHGLDWTLAARWTTALREVMSAFMPSQAGPVWPDPEELFNPDIQSFPAAVHIQPILNAHGFDREECEPFLRARRELFECDIRFGQLGGTGIFDVLDRDGVLTHHVPGVDNIEHAVEHPPAGGRAHVRGEAIRRLAGDPKEFLCDWTSIYSGAADTFLDLNDPFEQEERWRPFSVLGDGAHCMNHLPTGRALDWAPFTLRAEALEDFLAGRYVGAERALTELLTQRFEVPGTHCHLARVFLKTGQEERARQHVAQAWEARDEAPPYVVGRILWLQTLFVVIDDGDWRPWVGRLKGLTLERRDAQGWSMQPVLDHLRGRLREDMFEMMMALFRMVSGEDERSTLDRYAWWADV